ncbi:MAG: DUF1329 domain-containing protein [Desulfobacterales bacterium]|jgi:hypothetical protein|nr:DUF1329 domain-containing protein [Desulfobacterales bacterium]
MVKKIIAVFALVVGFSGYAMAALTQEELSQLGGDKLTAIGAEVAGNADGTIPPYTGGYTTVPPGFDRSKMMLPDPFADEKPLYSIDAKNMDQYKDKLSPSTIHMITKHADFRIDVYPTHRTVAIPDYIAEGTKRSAAVATLENDGKNLNGCWYGIPFPLPKNGQEAIWNHILRWSAPGEEFLRYNAFVITSAGRRILASEGHTYMEYPYWNPNATAHKDRHWMLDDRLIAPANRNGEGLMWFLSTDKSHGDPAWQYLPGQRRVKMAPEIAYDGPNTTVAGASTYDDAFIFTGSPDRYDWKILGKREMLVPYNNYKFIYHSTPDTAIGPHFINPDYVRWELHRVWVVEGTLKEGMRHIYIRRTLYLDEDSWIGLMADEYDNKNMLYRGMFSGLVFNYDTKAPFSTTYYGYDFVSGIYWVNAYLMGPNLLVTIRPDTVWSPQSLAGTGIR